MLAVLLLVSVLAAATAAPQAEDLTARSQPGDAVVLLKSETENDGVGSYRFSYEQSDGTKREEHGELKNPGTDEEDYSVEGSYEWKTPEGVTWIVNFIANTLGFQPKISQIPSK